MLQKLYNESSIKNPGECKVSQMFDEEFIYDDENTFYVFNSFLLANHIHKSQGECDFLVLSKKGLLVIEVKGGVIHYKDNTFYFPAYRNKPEKRFKESPFKQAETAKFSIIEFFEKKGISNCFVQSAVVFPDSPFAYEGAQFKNFWHQSNDLSLYDFIDQCFKDRRSLNESELSNEELESIVNVLHPTLTPSVSEVQIQANIKSSESNKEFNKKMLIGLDENPRLLIQGPPGSGKSTYGIDYAKRQINKGKKGLYLTYNLLLADNIKKKHSNISESLDVFALWPFFRHQLRENNIQFTPYNYDQEETLFLSNVHSQKKYDFIVVDEAQDLFSPALEKIINDFLTEPHGVENGEYVILYDLAQSFSNKGQLCYEYIYQNTAKFKLSDNFRASGSSELIGFINNCFRGNVVLNNLYQDIDVLNYSKRDEITSLLIGHVHQSLGNSHFKMKDMVILNTTNMYKNTENEKSILPLYHDNSSVFNILDDEINEEENRISVTSALRYKGLEKPVVYLIVDDLYSKKYKVFFQFLIGISRVQSKLILIVRE